MEPWMKAMFVLMISFSMFAGIVVAEDTDKTDDSGMDSSSDADEEMTSAEARTPAVGSYAAWRGYAKKSLRERLAMQKNVKAKAKMSNDVKTATTEDNPARLTAAARLQAAKNTAVAQRPVVPRATSVSGSCMQTAIENRDATVIKALGLLSTELQSALTVRKDALKLAWTLDDPQVRQEAKKKAWDEYKLSWKTAATHYRESRNAAWKDYVAYVKANCGVVDEDDTNANNEALEAIATA